MSLKVFLTALWCYLFCCLFCPTFLYSQDKDSVVTNTNNRNTVKLNNVQEILRRYEQAQYFYIQGKIDSVSRILQPYLKEKRLLRKIDKNLRSEIYRLAAMNYILADSLIEAEQNIKDVLNNQHNYQVRQGDLLSYQAAIDSMYISPRLTLGVRLGWIGTLVTQAENFSVISIKDNNIFGETYAFNAKGFSAGLASSYFLTRRIALQAETVLNIMSYDYELNLGLIGNSSQNNQNLYAYQMAFVGLEVPLLLKYHLLRRPNFSPFVLGGMFYRYLFSAIKVASNLALDYTPIMQQHNYGGVIGLGFVKSLGKRTRLSVDARYLNNFGLINLPDKRFLNNGSGNIDNFLYSSFDAIDNLKMQNIQVNLTLSYYLIYKVF